MVDVWGTGHTVPTEMTDTTEVCLDMDPPLETIGVLPNVLGIWVECDVVRHTNDAWIERIHDGRSGGRTPLYKPGHVALSGAAALKPYSQVRDIVVRYAGGDDMLDLPLKPGDVLYKKEFPVHTNPCVLTTFTKRGDREAHVAVDGFPEGLWPLYPYGGFVPPRGGIDQADMVFFVPGWAPQTRTTILQLYRQAYLEHRGGYVPDAFIWEGRTWQYQLTKTRPSFETLGGDFVNGCIQLKIQGVTYVSKSYVLWGGHTHRMKIFLEKHVVF